MDDAAFYQPFRQPCQDVSGVVESAPRERQAVLRGAASSTLGICVAPDFREVNGTVAREEVASSTRGEVRMGDRHEYSF
jgi:hypothetical protein